MGENSQLRELVEHHFNELEKVKSSQGNNYGRDGDDADQEDYKTLAYDLDEKLRMLIDENEKLNNLLSEKAEEAKEFGYLEEKMEFLIQENDRLNQIITENSQWKEKYLGIEKKLQSLFKD